MKVFVLGGSGACGATLIEQLCRQEKVSHIIAPARNPIKEIQHPKLQWIQAELIADTAWESLLQGVQMAYCCVGTTKAQTPNSKLYTAIDLGLPTRLAKACTRYGVQTIAAVSSIGANSNSKVFYSRTKGEMEKAIQEANIPYTLIVRPSLILAKRKKFRPGEMFAALIMRLFRPITPLKYRPITAEQIAKKMIQKTIINPQKGCVILESDALQKEG